MKTLSKPGNMIEILSTPFKDHQITDINVSRTDTANHEDRLIVAIYNSDTDAKSAIRKLQGSGSDMQRVSIIGRDFNMETQIVGAYNPGDRTNWRGKKGDIWSWIWGWHFGWNEKVNGGIGPILLVGPIVGWLEKALESELAIGGMSALGTGLSTMGIPPNSVVKCETALKADKFIIIAEGSTAQ